MNAILRNWTFAILWLLTFTIPWEAAVQFTAIGTLSRAVGLLVLPIAAAALVVGGRRHRLLDSHFIMLGLAAWAFLSMIWSVRLSTTLQSAATMLQLVAMVLLLWEFGRDDGRQRQLLWAFVLGALVGATATFQAALTHGAVTTTEVRFSEGGLNENHAAFVFSLAIPVAWHLSMTSVRALHRFVAGLYVPAGAVAAVLTGSRGGLLILFLALSILPLTLHRGGIRAKILALVSLATISLLAASIVPAQTIDRLGSIPNELASGSLGSRGQLWEVSWSVFGSEPLTGVGAGASRYVIGPIAGREQAPHNTYLSLAADLGVVGLGLFLLLLLSLAGRVVGQDGERLLAGVLFVTLLIGLLPGHREYVKITWLIVALILAETARPGRALNRSVIRKGSPRQSGAKDAMLVAAVRPTDE